MIFTVIGGASSKKSEYAEAVVKKVASKPPVYLATMLNLSKEDEKIVERHKKLRQGKGFVTVEKPIRLYEAKLPCCDTVLLEDVSNLIANEFFSYEKPPSKQKALSEIIKGVDFLALSVQNLVIVTGNVFEDGIAYDEFTQNYLQAFGQVNKYIAQISDVFIEMTAGFPVFYKGSFVL